MCVFVFISNSLPSSVLTVMFFPFFKSISTSDEPGRTASLRPDFHLHEVEFDEDDPELWLLLQAACAREPCQGGRKNVYLI